MFSFALTNQYMTTNLPTTISRFAIANTSLRLNTTKKSKKVKSKKGDLIRNFCFNRLTKKIIKRYLTFLIYF